MAQKFTVPVTIKQLSSSGSDAITVYVDADTYARLKVEAGGRLTWGSGSGAGDVNLYRDSADVLKTDDKFIAGKELASAHSSGDEGGEIQLAIPQTNTTISSGVAIDVYQNKLRIYETGGSNRGAYIDLTAASNGVASNLLSGGGGASDLDGLTDVTITSAASGDFLVYNGTAWINDAALTAALFDTSVGSPNSTEGKLQWDSDFGTLSFGLEGNNAVQQIGINQFAYCYNAEATTLTKGEAVYIFGGQGSQVSIKRASNSAESTSSKTLGLVAESITAGGSGYVCTYGAFQGINTNAYSEGDILWLGSTGGTLTTTKPTGPNHAVFIGVVIKDAVGGEIWLRPQNGFELDELHNVSLSSVSAGQYLAYNGTNWVNSAINMIDIYDFDTSSFSNGDLVSYNSSSSLYEGVSRSSVTRDSEIKLLMEVM